MDIPWAQLSPESLETIETIVFSISDGYSYAEIAEMLGVEHKDVIVRMHRLREEIAGLTNLDDPAAF